MKICHKQNKITILMSPAPIFCLICETEIFSPNGTKRYCEPCKIKQQQAKTKRLANTNKYFSRIKRVVIESKERACEMCGKGFKTFGGLHSLHQRFCSKPCQFSWQKKYNREIIHTTKRGVPANSPVLQTITRRLDELPGEIEKSIE